nr:putative protein N(5)-glutamine methyltransferase [Actinoplanes sp. TFC3]
MVAGAIEQLRVAGCVFAEEEAAVLVEAAGADAGLMQALVARRVGGEPLEQVVGYADFCGVRVKLRPGVFVPRVRSELLVRTAAQKPQIATVIDLCCGSGALGLALRNLRPGIDLYATDSDPAAVACAAENLYSTTVLQGNLFDPLPPNLKADILLANVPYVATKHIPFLPAEARDYEPHTALDGGHDGLEIFRAVIEQAGHWLQPGGMLLSEVTEAQTATAVHLIERQGLHPGVHSDEDLGATVVTATRASS